MFASAIARVVSEVGSGSRSVVEPNGGEGRGPTLAVWPVRSPQGWQEIIEAPLRTALKGSRSLTKGYTVYLRSIVRSDQSALTYYGITFRHWLHRLKEHVAAANGGSPLLFHRALRDQLKGRSKISAHDHRRWPDQGRGQANRLSAEQVRQIRMLAALGHSTSAIVARSGASGADQVRESSATGHTSASGDKA